MKIAQLLWIAVTLPQASISLFSIHPFNQDKAYNAWDDNLPPEKYWEWMRDICAKVYALTSDGGAIYFMQREKNTEFVLECLRSTGWTFQNLIIWKKKTSAVPGTKRFGKHYQVIAFATKGKTPPRFPSFTY